MRKILRFTILAVMVSLFVAVIIFLTLDFRAATGQVTLAWDQTAGADSYTIHYGTQSGIYDYSASTGSDTFASIGGLEYDTIYYFAVTATNAQGESDYSEELAYYANMPNICEGDFNDDKAVNHLDLPVFFGEYGRTDCHTNYCEADFDDDGEVGSSDMMTMLTYYGRTDCD